MTTKVTQYKGFKVHETQDIAMGSPLFVVYTPEEWAYGKGIRSYEWEASTMQEAKDFIDGY
ncbi:hypothetical protein ACWA2B_10690 [Paenibacillus sp. CMM36]